MKRNQILIITLIGLAVIASGCTDNTTTTEGSSAVEAVKITNFTAVPSEAYDTQPVSLRIRMENTGLTTAENPRVKIFNLPDEGTLEEGAWGYEQGVYLENKTVKGMMDIAPADPENNIPSRPLVKQVTLLPPDLDQNKESPRTIGGRFSYDYETTAESQIQLMGNQRFLEEGKAQTEPATKNSAGPIKMDLKISSPLVFFKGRDGSVSVKDNLAVVIQNKGDGVPTPPGEPKNSDTEGKVVLTLESPGLEYSSTTDPDNENQATVKLTGNTGREYFDIEGLDQFNTEDIQKTIPITMTAHYRYYKEAQTTVTVKGRRGDSGLN